MFGGSKLAAITSATAERALKTLRCLIKANLRQTVATNNSVGGAEHAGIILGGAAR